MPDIETGESQLELIVHVSSCGFIDVPLRGGDVVHAAFRWRQQDRVVQLVQPGRFEECRQPPRPQDTVVDGLETTSDELASSGTSGADDHPVLVCRLRKPGCHGALVQEPVERVPSDQDAG